jgi:ATP-dependent Clp protease ATP-binding subunit ClpA
MRHEYVEPEHFLLALLTKIDNPASRILNLFGMNNDNVRPIVRDMHPSYEVGEGRVTEQLTEVSTRVVNGSITLAQRHCTDALATPMHVLVLLIESRHKQVLHVFDTLGVNPDHVVVDAAKSILSGVS